MFMAVAGVADVAALWILVYPGAIASMLITGGHGGTHMEDYLGAAVSFFVNVLTYAVIGTTAAATVRAIRRKRSPSRD